MKMPLQTERSIDSAIFRKVTVDEALEQLNGVNCCPWERHPPASLTVPLWMQL